MKKKNTTAAAAASLPALDPAVARLTVRAFFDEITEPDSTGKQIPLPLELMFAAGRAIGLTANIPRSANFGTRSKPNVKKLVEASPAEIRRYAAAQQSLGIRSPVFGSALGKGRLVVEGPEDRGRFWVPAQKYLETEVTKVGNIAAELGATEVRIFTFNTPSGAESEQYILPSIDRTRSVVGFLQQKFGLRSRAEIEVHLVGDTSQNLLRICQAIPGFGAVWDFGNVSSQGDNLFDSFKTLFPVVRHLHAKHYAGPVAKSRGAVAEDHLRHYFPLNYRAEETGIVEVLNFLRTNWPKFVAALMADGAKEAAIDLEPHVRGGGVFGGASGIDGLMIALIGLIEVLASCGISTDLPNAQTLIAERKQS